MAFSYLAINTPLESDWEKIECLNQKLVSFTTAEIAAALYLLEQGVPYSVFIIINQSRLRHKSILGLLMMHLCQGKKILSEILYVITASWGTVDCERGHILFHNLPLMFAHGVFFTIYQNLVLKQATGYPLM